MAPSPKSRLTAVRLEAEGVSAAEVELRLFSAYVAINQVIGGDAVYGMQVIEQDHTEVDLVDGDGRTVMTRHDNGGGLTKFRGRAKIWPNVADDAPQHAALSLVLVDK